MAPKWPKMAKNAKFPYNFFLSFLLKKKRRISKFEKKMEFWGDIESETPCKNFGKWPQRALWALKGPKRPKFQNWPNMPEDKLDQNGQKWRKMAQNGQNWPKMAPNGQNFKNWPNVPEDKLDQNGVKWPKMTKIGQNWPNMAQNRPQKGPAASPVSSRAS